MIMAGVAKHAAIPIHMTNMLIRSNLPDKELFTFQKQRDTASSQKDLTSPTDSQLVRLSDLISSPAK